jgi:hypothetical protein
MIDADGFFKSLACAAVLVILIWVCVRLAEMRNRNK